MPIAPAPFARACPGLTLASLLPGATGALVVGDGGGEFFARFRAAGELAGADPLDRYTTKTVAAAVAGAVPAGQARVLHPFTPPMLPMQALGEAAGLPPAGPLGIQIHPRWGPWWAYRAVIVLAEPALAASAVLDPAQAAEAPLPRPCEGCPAPCLPACPAGAATRAGFAIGSCVEHRLGHVACQQACAARSACIVAPEAAYPASQLAFHMDASLVMIRAYRRG